MLKSLKKFFLFGATLVLGATMFTGCSNALAKATDEIGADAVEALNRNQVVREVTDVEFNDFSFLGADFTRADENSMDVDVSGIAKYNEGDKAFVTMSYNLSDDHFSGIKESKKSEVVKALGTAMKTEEMKDFDMMPISNVKALNGVLKTISASPLDDFRFHKGMVVSLGNLKFNEEEGSVSFQMKTHVDYHKSETKTEMGLVYDPINGGHKMGLVTKTYNYYEDFLHTNDVYIKVSEEDMALMKLDPSFVVDNFINYVKSGEREKYVINSVSIDKTSGLDATMIDDLDYEKL